ncbi:MAG TPA: ArnT family glycosyltransferase [Candidatus Tripitaka californicus]|uniref:ArnT family glycosyltransferase n=2 Tax=Candidatus Tripitaka californicus TaxID=3367616 RepID=UPI0040294605
MSSSEKRHLLFLVLFALLLRLYVFVATPVIGTDGYNWFNSARCFAEGDFKAGFRHPVHPCYPILFAVFTKLLGDYEVAGKAVALVMGVLSIFPLYFFARGVFGHYAGLFAAFLLAVNPTHVRLSADIMSDTTNLFFFLGAIWLGWEAIKVGQWQYYTLAGVCATLGYFTRAESLGLLAVMLPWFIFAAANLPQARLANVQELKRRLLKRVVCVGLFIAPVILLSVPYLLFIHKEKGSWHVTQQLAARFATGQVKMTPILTGEDGRKPGGRVHEQEKIAGWKEKGQYHMICLLVLNEFAKDFYQPLLPLLLIGLFRFASPPKVGGVRITQGLLSLRLRLPSSDSRGEFFLLSFFGLYFFLYYLFAYNAYYISGRYVLPMAVLSFVWAGVGVEKVSQWLCQVVPSLGRDTQGFNRAGLLLLLALLVVVLPKDLKIKRKEEVVKKEVGYWLRTNSPVKRPVIVGMGSLDLEKVAFYAGGEFRHLSPAEYNIFQGFINEWKPDYIIFYNEELSERVSGTVDKSTNFVFLKEWVCKRKGEESHLRLYSVKRDAR